MSGGEEVQVGTVGPCPQLVPRFGPDFYREMERLRDESLAEGKSGCVCNIGVQECSEHPGRLLTKEERIAFRVQWDGRVS